MRFLRFSILFSCMFFAAFSAFASEIITFHLTGGTQVGTPSDFFMKPTSKIFCADLSCTHTIQYLDTNPINNALEYLGSVVNGTQIINRQGQFAVSDDVFDKDWSTLTEYNVTNLFSDGLQQIILNLTGVTGITPNPIIHKSGIAGWASSTGTPYTELDSLPTLAGKVFMGFSTSTNPEDSGALTVIDSSGFILSTAESLSGTLDIYPIWKNVQVTCSTGQYLPANTYSSAQCPAGSWCDGGTFEANQSADQGINACDAGTYSDSGADSSDDCYEVTTCPAGQYLLANTSGCTECPYDNWCPGGTYQTNQSNDQGITSCGVGFISNAGSSSVEDCYELPSSAICPAGQYLGANNYYCSPCQKNNWCPGGTYQTNQSTIQGMNPCETGLVSELGAATCQEPEDMTHCMAGQYYVPDSAEICVTCPANYFCAGGDYPTNSTNPQGLKLCAAGLVSDEGSDSSDDCHEVATCAAGQFLKANTNSCSPCSENNWCPGGTYQLNPSKDQGINACDADLSSAEGSTSAEDCYTTIYCGPGEYVPENSSSCAICLADNWCIGGIFNIISGGAAQGITPCNPGTFSDEGSNSASACNASVICSPGLYLPEKSTHCDACLVNSWCPGGTFEPNQSIAQGINDCATGLIADGWASRAEDCYVAATCAAGEYLPANSSSCEQCSVGSWCAGGVYPINMYENQGINPCENDMTSILGTASYEDCHLPEDMITCTSGQYYLPDNADTCTICPANYWCVGGVYLKNSIDKQGIEACDDGLVSAEGSTNAEACITSTAVTTCSAGQYLPVNSSSCAQCPVGSWCPGGTYTINQSTDQGKNACGGGLTSNLGSSSANACYVQVATIINCNEGKYLPADSTECSICPANYWCDGGNFESAAGEDRGLKACAEGRGSDEGSTSEAACYPVTTCDAGAYLPANSMTCQICPADSWCEGGTFRQSTKPQGINACDEGFRSDAGATSNNGCYPITTCAAGQYLPTGSTECAICTAGNWCDGGTYQLNPSTDQGINACANGLVSNAGSTSAEDCYTTIYCGPGEYIPENSSSCAICPANSWCIGGIFNIISGGAAQGINSCANGLVSAEGSTNAAACINTITCAEGEYMPADSTECAICPANNWCAGGNFTVNNPVIKGLNACAEGLVSDEGSRNAAACHEVATCDAGEYLPANSMTCIICPANSWCPGGQFSQSTSVQGINACGAGFISFEATTSVLGCHAVTTCAAGQYLPANSASCTQCPMGSWCAGGTYQINQSTAQGRNSCGAGLTSDAGSTSANACQVTVATITCAAGQYLPENSTECTICPANYWCDGGTFDASAGPARGINACAEGRVSDEGSANAEACNEVATCDAGSYLPANSMTCTICPTNSWCAGGTFSQSTSDQGINYCGAGFFSYAATTSVNGCYAMTTCSAGSFLPPNSSSCAQCTVGSWCQGGTFSQSTSAQGINACPNGFSSWGGTSNVNGCYFAMTCPAGQYMPANSSSSCAQCPMGSWCPGGTYTINQSTDQGKNACGGGLTSNPGSSSANACYVQVATINCNEGQYLPADSSECAICPANYWCDGGTFESAEGEDRGINACAGETVSDEGSTNPEDCHAVTTCTAGEYLPANSMTCTICPANSWCPGGTYQQNAEYIQGLNSCPDGFISEEGAPGANHCHQIYCGGGDYLPENSIDCTRCPAGSWCPGGTFSQSASAQGINACPDGFGSWVGSTSVNNCRKITTTCGAGQYLPIYSDTCSQCTANSWCPGGTYPMNQSTNQGITNCVYGLISDPGSASAEACITPTASTVTCTAGQFLPPNSSSCTQCPGYNWCPGGTFSPSTSAQGINYCGGGFSELGSSSIEDCKLLCTPGQYLPANSRTRQVCTANSWCPGGEFYQSTSDQGINYCGDGFTSYPGSASAEACITPTASTVTCAEGQYLPENTLTCQTCPASRWCAGGTFSQSTSAQGINACPPGSTSDEGSTSVEDCKARCDASFYLLANTLLCSGCPAGSWCPGGIFYKSTDAQGINACPDGFTSRLYSTNAESCTPVTTTCSGGQYLPANSSLCATCPANNWCPGGPFSQSTSAQGINACGSGFISSEGTANIIGCHAAKSCSAGQYLPANSITCTRCPANNWCPGGTFLQNVEYIQGLNSCQNGLISAEASSSANHCHQIYCAGGDYLPENSVDCTQCPANSWCPGGGFGQSTSAQGINACGSGFISDPGSYDAEDCRSLIETNTTCGAGQYLPANTLTCETCPANSWCPGGTFSQSTEAQGANVCPSEGISSTGSEAMGQCKKDGLVFSGVSHGAGTQTCYWETVGYTSGCFDYIVTACDAGYYWAGGDAQCDEVGIGYFSYDGEIERRSCPALENTPRIQGTTETTTSPDSNSCFVEVPFVSGENGMGTMRCSFAKGTLYGNAEQYDEEKNEFPTAPAEGDSQCTNLGISFCFGGFFATVPTHCDPVGNGNYSQRPDLAKYIERGCLTNPEICAEEYGYDLSKPATFLGQTACPKPYVNSEGKRDNITTCFKNCEAISVTNSASVTAVSETINYGAQDTVCKFNITCQDGFHVSENGTAKPSCVENAATDTTCTAGQYLPANSATCSTCTANSWCAGGTYTINQSTAQGITACGTGMFSAAGSSSSEACHANAVRCSAGQYMPANQSSCSQCPANSWCPGGNFQVNLSTDHGITACGTGLVSDAGSSSSSACHAVPVSSTVICSEGEYLPANSATCSTCTANSWCAGGTYTINQSTNQGITECDRGLVSAAGSSSSDACYASAVRCAAGQYMRAKQTSCSQCPVNNWCPGGNFQVNLSTDHGITACGTGLVSDAGSSSSAACHIRTTTCSAGQYLPSRSDTCSECTANSWCAGGTYEINKSSAQGITACISGRFSDAGSSSSDECQTNIITCAAGQYLPANSATCTTCVAGNYCTGGTFNQSTSIQGLAACPNNGTSIAQSTAATSCYKTCSSTGMNIPNSTSITPTAEKVYWASNAYPSCSFDVVCNSGYSVVNNSGTLSCVLDEVVCDTDPNASAFNSKCEPTKCKFGYHFEDNLCTPNRTSCSITNGTGVKEWMGDNIKGGKWTACTVASCDDGYTSDRALTDENKLCGACRNMYDADGEVAVSSWANSNCEIATCMYQGELYRLSNNECIKICDAKEDDTGTMQWNLTTETCDRTCNPGFSSW